MHGKAFVTCEVFFSVLKVFLESVIKNASLKSHILPALTSSSLGADNCSANSEAGTHSTGLVT